MKPMIVSNKNNYEVIIATIFLTATCSVT